MGRVTALVCSYAVTPIVVACCSSEGGMTIQTYTMILVNSRVLVPQSWIGFIDSSVQFETFPTSDTLSTLGVPNLVSACNFERYAAFTELHILLHKGFVVLTRYGFEQLALLWH